MPSRHEIEKRLDESARKLRENRGSVVELASKVQEIARQAGVEYKNSPEDDENYVTMTADFENDFTPVRQALEQAFGPAQWLNHVEHLGYDEEIEEDDEFEGFLVGGNVVQFEEGSEEFIQVFPSASVTSP